MNKTIEEAKKCICPVMYDANMKLELSSILTVENSDGNCIFNCIADKCMAWDELTACSECRESIRNSSVFGAIVKNCNCECDETIKTGYCKIIG